MLEPDFVGGINSYALGLIKGFSESEKENTFVLFVTKRNQKLFQHFLDHKNFSFIVYDDSTFYQRFAWKFTSILLRFGFGFLHKKLHTILFSKLSKTLSQQVDLVYSPFPVAFPYKWLCPTVVSIHDIQHVYHPEFFSEAELNYRNVTYNFTALNSTYLQASSQFIRSNFEEYFTFLDKEQITVIPEGVDLELFSVPSLNKNLLEAYSLPKDFLFYPAQLWLHKDHLTLFEALNQIKKKTGLHIPIVLTGGTYSASKKVFDFIERHKMTNVFYLGKIPFTDIIELYQKAKILVHVSLHESSCLPVLEAAAAGTAIIASDIPPNIEMSKILDLKLFPCSNAELLSELIIELWNSDTMRKEQILHNRKAILQSSWKDAANKYLALFETLKSKQN